MLGIYLFSVFGSSATYLSVPSIDELDDISEAISVSVSDSADTVPSLSSVLQPPEAGNSQ